LAPLLGISSSWGRFFFLYGPREQSTRLVPSIIRSLLAGGRAQCLNREQTRDFLYVEDAARALVKLLESDVIGAVNIASGVPVMLRDIVEMLGDKLGRPDLISSGSERHSGTEPLTLIGDVRRLREEVGWSPRFSLSSGLDKAIEWWREQ
jgi:nucleoside-diphosphate-sugar epimerase